MADFRAKRPNPKKKRVNKQLIIKALTEPKFRKMLATEPEKAIGMQRLSVENRTEIRFVLATAKAIESHIAGLADELLCANGGGCGIAAV
jgi:hypothetical protein